jgi:hypothetical protein
MSADLVNQLASALRTAVELHERLTAVDPNYIAGIATTRWTGS